MKKKTYSYRVAMIGFDAIEGTLLASSRSEAEGQALLLFEQTNGIDSSGSTIPERVKFYAPQVQPVRQ